MEESYGVEMSCGVSDESTDVELGGVEEMSLRGGEVVNEGMGACGGLVDGEETDGDGGNRDGIVLSDGGVDEDIGLPGTSAGLLLNAVVSSSRGGRGAARGGRGGCSRRKKRSGGEGLVEEPQPGVSKRMKDKMKQEELKRDMVDLQYILNGIDEIMMNQVLKCADSNLAGLVKLEEECDAEDKATFTQARKTSLKKFWDMSVMLTETKAQVAACPAVVNEVFEDLDLERILTSEEDDGQFLALIREFEEAADLKIQEKWKEIGMKQVNKSDNYQKFLEVIYRYQDKNQDDKHNPGTSTGPGGTSTGPGGISTRNTDRSATYHESQGVQELSEYIPTTDPVTRKPLKNPCKNKRCGHVYDYDSMMDLIITSGVKRMRCPYTSCPNKVPLVQDELVIDVVLARKIAEKIAAEGGAC